MGSSRAGTTLLGVSGTFIKMVFTSALLKLGHVNVFSALGEFRAMVRIKAFDAFVDGVIARVILAELALLEKSLRVLASWCSL